MGEFLLVAAICSKTPNIGCREITDLHLKRNTELRNSLVYIEQVANRTIGEKGKYLLQVAAFASGRNFKITLDKHSEIVLNSNGIVYGFKMTFP